MPTGRPVEAVEFERDWLVEARQRREIVQLIGNLYEKMEIRRKAGDTQKVPGHAPVPEAQDPGSEPECER